MSKLKALQASDPAKFKEAMSAISKKLTKEADASTDAKQKQVLTDMASKFSTAGQTGDLSGITPPSGASGAKGGHHGGGHGGPPPGGGGVKGASSSSSSSSTTSAGAADTNGDGKVSEAELAAYTVKQEDSGAEPPSSSSESKRAAQAYAKLQDKGPPEAIKTAMSDISSIIDQYAA